MTRVSKFAGAGEDALFSFDEATDGTRTPVVKVDDISTLLALAQAAGLNINLVGASGGVTINVAEADLAALGAVSGAAVITDANGTIQQFLRGLVKLASSTGLIVGASENAVGLVGGHSIVWQEADGTKTRPANATAYAANGLIGTATDCIFKFSNFFRKNANTGYLTGLRLTANGSGIAVANMGSVRAHLFSAAPALSSNADQATYNTLNSNKAIGLGYVDFSTWNIGGGSSDIIGSYGFPPVTPLPIRAASAARDLYAVVVASGAFTPLSAAVIDMFASADEN